MSITWWEKTVEYMAVLDWSRDQVGFAPLDGKHERAADLIASSNYSLVLVEFKRCAQQISSEEKKFPDFKRAKEELKFDDQHHRLIYGELDKATRQLNLRCRTYFSAQPIKFADALKCGVSMEKFDSYLKKLMHWKKLSSESGSGGNNGGPDFSNVAVIACGKGKTHVMSFSEYKGLHQDPSYDPSGPERTPSQSPSGPSMG